MADPTPSTSASTLDLAAAPSVVASFSPSSISARPHSKGKQRADGAFAPGATGLGAGEWPTEAEQEYKEALDQEAGEYERQNELLRAQVRTIQEEIEALGEPTDGSTDEAKPAALLAGKLAALEAELESLDADPPPESDPYLNQSYLAAMEEAYLSVKDTVRGLKKAEEWEKDRKVKEEIKLARDRILLDDAEKLNRILAQRLEQAQLERNQPDGELLVLQAQGRRAHMTERFRRLQTGLIAFIDGYFAASDDENADGSTAKAKASLSSTLHLYFRPVAKGLNDKNDTPASRAFSLKKLIEMLMNRAVASPLDPWILVDDPSSAPRELLDFLLRAGIIREHPRDPKKVRLVEFGTVME
ncbi:hypothetical protein JCM1841_003127 [Sporobolomyces salmonicolor]